VNVFLWHVHGSWTTAFVQGAHDYFVPVTPDRGPDGRGRAQTWEWPARVREVSPADARDLPVDVVVLQRPSELTELAPRWLGGRRPGRDVPTVYLEHNTPADPLGATKHPVADRDDLTLVHVTHWNALFWETGTTETRVIEHGIVDPGYRYTGELAHLGVVINDGTRRARATGTDLLTRFAAAGPIDLFGFDASRLGGTENLSQAELHDELPRRRVYVHPNRWTSLGLSLIEAMHLGLPVVAVAATEVPEAVPPGCGFVSTDVDRLVRHARALLHDPELARQMGRCAREAARRRYGLRRFLDDWDALLEEVAA
jgi:hypothetical protein